jgi:hypothetical protein
MKIRSSNFGTFPGVQNENESELSVELTKENLLFLLNQHPSKEEKSIETQSPLLS